MMLSRMMDMIFDENATASDLLKLVAGLAVFWGLFFALMGAVLRPLIHNKMWLVAAGEREYERGGREMAEMLGLGKSKEDFVEYFVNSRPDMLAIIAQHTVGGILCLPSLLGIGDPSTAASLACLGILSEMGWEVEDAFMLFIKRFGLANGKAKVPTGLIILFLVHHSLTMSLGLPLILHYRNLETLHMICFDLQAAGATSLAISEYTKMLDISKPRQLRQFQVLTFIALVVLVWTRAIHWLYLCAKFIMIWHHDKAWRILVMGTIMSLVFSAFNWIFCIKPFYTRFAKFMKVSAEYSALPADVEPKTRRPSRIELDAAAADILNKGQWQEELAAIFVERRVSRRNTLPPCMFRDKRRSFNLLRSSAGDVSRILSQMDGAFKEE